MDNGLVEWRLIRYGRRAADIYKGPVRMQRAGETISSKEFAENLMYLRYVYKVRSTELCNGLDIKDEQEEM